MTTDVTASSAQVIPFPAGGRRGLAGPSRQPKNEMEACMPQAVANALGSAWYHDDAIQDTKRAGER